MIEIVGKKCCGCGACKNICPKKSINFVVNTEGFLYPEINYNCCTRCNLCEKVCPILNHSYGEINLIEEAWGAKAIEYQLRYESSSGGIFSLLSEQILTRDGVVYGAAFTNKFRSIGHVAVTESKELYKLRGSKYIQSDTGICFSEIKNHLENRQKVLFTGTPCQVAGLKSFLRKDYENLFCVDVICHGTPPAALWQKYLDYIEKKHVGKIVSVNFRHKEKGWKEFGFDLEKEKIRYYRNMRDDPYIRMFLKNYCLRESCYQCEIKNSGYQSDITIGDFWGVETVAREIADDLGVSLVIIHTNKGKSLFEKIQPFIKSVSVDTTQAVSHNSAYFKSVTRPNERNCFFDDMNMLTWEQLTKKYLTEKIKVRIKRQIKRFVLNLKSTKGKEN